MLLNDTENKFIRVVNETYLSFLYSLKIQIKIIYNCLKLKIQIQKLTKF